MSLFALEAWADVVPIEQDDGPTPIAAIKYSVYYKQMMDIFRAVVSSGEYSERVLDLTKSILAVNAANYTVWQYRRECLFAVGADLGAELDYMDSFSEDNPKNYQIWHHRRVIAERSRAGRREMAFTTTVFGVDAKNYHGWAHRQWVLQEFQLWEEELDFIDKLLQEDVRNNSAWNQRWFVVHNGPTPFTVDVFTREVEYAFRNIVTAKDNESAWNYLRGLLLRSPSAVPGAAEKNSILLRLKEDCANVNEAENTCRHLYALTAEMCESLEVVDDYPLAVGLWTKLAETLDCIRKKYWLSRIEQLSFRISA